MKLTAVLDLYVSLEDIELRGAILVKKHPLTDEKDPRESAVLFHSLFRTSRGETMPWVEYTCLPRVVKMMWWKWFGFGPSNKAID